MKKFNIKPRTEIINAGRLRIKESDRLAAVTMELNKLGAKIIEKEDGLVDMPNPKGLKYVESFDKHMNVSGIHKYLKELKERTFDKYDIMTVGEANGVDAEEADLWVGEKDGKFNMIFQFEHLHLWELKVRTILMLEIIRKY